MAPESVSSGLDHERYRLRWRTGPSLVATLLRAVFLYPLMAYLVVHAGVALWWGTADGLTLVLGFLCLVALPVLVVGWDVLGQRRNADIELSTTHLRSIPVHAPFLGYRRPWTALRACAVDRWETKDRDGGRSSVEYALVVRERRDRIVPLVTTSRPEELWWLARRIDARCAASDAPLPEEAERVGRLGRGRTAASVDEAPEDTTSWR